MIFVVINWFKRKSKDKKLRNCHHEDFAHLVEPAFVGHGVHSDKTQYYRFKGDSELDMIAGRYNKGSKFMIEAVMRMDAESLKFYLDEMEKELSKSEINIVNIAKWISIMRDRTDLLIDSKTAMKLASVSYFDETEVLDGYDFEYGLKKIDAWEKGGDYSFFFKKPMSDLLPLPASWENDFQAMKNYMALADTNIESRTNTEKPMTA